MAVGVTGGVGFKCTGCGTRAFFFRARCSTCLRWNSFVRPWVKPRPVVQAIAAVDVRPVRVSSGFKAWDYVLGGGLLAGSAVFLSGRRGAGKSTLLVQLAARYQAFGPVLYAAGEESRAQVAERAARVAAVCPGVLVVESCEVESVLEAAKRARAAVVVVDSIQEVKRAHGADGIEATYEAQRELVHALKAAGRSLLACSQLNQRGETLGGQRLEHLPDVLVRVEGDGDKPGSLRELYIEGKNRFGAAAGVRARMRFSAEGFANV